MTTLPVSMPLNYSAAGAMPRKWIRTGDLCFWVIPCATLIALISIVLPTAQAMFPEFGLQSTRLAEALFSWAAWLRWQHAVYYLAVAPVVAGLIGARVRSVHSTRNLRSSALLGLLAGSVLILTTLVILLAPAIRQHRQLDVATPSDQEDYQTTPLSFDGFRSLCAYVTRCEIDSGDLNHAMLLAAGAKTWVHEWPLDSRLELLVIEPQVTPVTGYSMPHAQRMTYSRSMAGNGTYYFVLHDVTSGGCTLVGRGEGNSCEFDDRGPAPTLQTYFHGSIREGSLTTFTWDGAMFRFTRDEHQVIPQEGKRE